MRKHNQEFKIKIPLMGRELNSIITYDDITLSNEELNEVTPVLQSELLKSVMKELDIDSNVDIPLGTEINYKFGVKLDNGEYEYLDFGNYIVYSSEKQEDTNSYSIIAYDKMLYSMKTYTLLPIEYPITVRDYINAVCIHIGLEFANVEDEFVNYEKILTKELYLDDEGESLGYTFRDVLDELSQVTASNIIINNDDKVEIKYITDTNDTIDEEYLKDVNVKFGEKYGPVNSIVLSRSESDNIYLQDEKSIVENGLCELKIKNNQIMNFNNRDEFLPEILGKLNGLEYYLNDFSSTGVCYYEICDKYNVQIGENIYPCILFNDKISITQGLEETIYTDLPEEAETDYTKADKTDRRLSQTTLIVDKQQQTIEGLVSDMYDENGIVHENFARLLIELNNIMLGVQNSSGTNLLKNSVMFAYDTDNNPDDWEVSSDGELLISSSAEALNAGSVSGHVFTLKNKMVKQRVRVKLDTDNIPENEKTYYTFSTKIKKDITGTCYVKIYNSNEEYIIKLEEGESSFYGDYEIKALLPKDTYYDVEFYGSIDSNATFTDNMFTIGEYKKQWSQASGEIMNTQVNINLDGVLVKSSVYQGDYTVMSPLEFAGYSNINGTITKVFSLNKDTTLVKKLEAEDEIKMNPIKIVPITTGDLQGWAFVPSSELEV